MRGEIVPGFADVVRPPAWQTCSGELRVQLARVLALLAARKAIDAELHGPSLARLAACVGEDAFDRVCDAQIDELALPDVPASLPLPAELAARGEILLAAAARSAKLAPLAAIAHDICMQSANREFAA
ncbi:hypothetical protein ACXYN8_00705 [Altererythrobacter sp. CAU 1778]